MSGTLSTRWFWSDWMSDPGLRACGYAARGLWKDLLCIAGSNKTEYGYVSLNGNKLDSAAIARMTNGTPEEVDQLLAELGQNGVYSKDRRGVIYCRRMVRAEKSRSNGRLGGNPNLLKLKKNMKQVNRRANPLVPVVPEPEPVKEPAGAGLFDGAIATSDWPKAYQDQFWSLYPRRTEKKSALAKLDAIRKSGKVRWTVLIDGVARYARHMAGTEDRYIKHPTTWLNRGCWDDELPQGPQSNGPETRSGAQSLLIEIYERGGNDVDDEGVADRPALPAR